MNKQELKIQEEILDRTWKKLHSTFIDCPACEGMKDDPQYTCDVCWSDGGNGSIPLNTVINRFESYYDNN